MHPETGTRSMHPIMIPIVIVYQLEDHLASSMLQSKGYFVAIHEYASNSWQ